MRASRAALLQHLQRLFRRSPWTAELCCALTAMLWAALSMAAPVDLQAWPSMRLLLQLGPEEFWQAAAVTLGAWQFVSLACDWRWARWFASLAMGWFWGVMALGAWVATPWSPGVAAYAGWVAVSVFSVTRLLCRGG